MGYYNYGRRRHDFEITKREVLFSIAIIAVMTLIGFVIHGKISDNLMNEYQNTTPHYKLIIILKCSHMV